MPVAIDPGKGTQKSRGRLRIVAGIWRSRVLEIADVEGLRPTSERIRETLFNWLTPRMAGARCLDLFAGTGALGLEALSRGAAAAVFVENSKVAIATLRRNLASLDASGGVIHAGSATEYIDAAGAESFDIVFLDPPFADDNLAELCKLVDESELVATNANVYLEQDRARPEPDLPDGWTVLKSKVAGNVRYTLAAVGPR
ncbi:MAG: 16S rRNA (guanine(966)-N(2))-methyltransferase RsmD [Proteobacteria bacterium]|nr:16S rRNA (guanine(966)-N(2))-methyltransferase RsmD [Pseudomonadota bacterium]